MKNNVAFTLISFAVLEWDDCLSVKVLFELPVQIPVQLLLELEVNWLDQNVNELEFELSRMCMKRVPHETTHYLFRWTHVDSVHTILYINFHVIKKLLLHYS